MMLAVWQPALFKSPNDRELMGRLRNGALLNRVAIAIVAFVSICGAAYGIDSFLRTAHLI